MKDTVAGRKSQGARAAAPKRFIAKCNAHERAYGKTANMFMSDVAV